MDGYFYDEDASADEGYDVIYHVDDRAAPVARWLDAMRSLNKINDPLARRLLALHRDCGTGSGECDSVDDVAIAFRDRVAWGCATVETIAEHYGVVYPGPPGSPPLHAEAENG